MKKDRLSAVERETIILYNEAESTAEVYTHNFLINLIKIIIRHRSKIYINILPSFTICKFLGGFHRYFKIFSVFCNIKTITVADMYGFITYCGTERNVTAATRARKIVSIRQFWKYLKNKAHLLESNIAEELEAPKLPNV